MNDREKQILKILRRNPLIQQNEIADILQISRSRVAAHIMDLMRKGMIKGKGYILTEQDYCVVVGAINMDIRGVADIHYPQAASNPGSIHCSAGGVGRNIAHNLALLGRDVHLISAVGSDFYGETLLEQTRQAGVNVSSCIRLHGHNTSTYLSIANQQEETVLAINDTHILQQLTPQLLNSSRDLIRHSGVVLADCNLTAEAIEWVFTIADDIPEFENYIPNGIGNVGAFTVADTVEPIVEYADKLQKYLVNHTRLGIPALIHWGTVYGGGCISECNSAGVNV